MTPVSLQGRDEREVDIAGAGRQVDQEIVEFAPMRILDKLLDSIGSHAATPDDRLLGIDEETDRKHAYAVLLDGLDQRASVLLDRHGTAVLGMEHLRHGRTVDIGIQQAYAIAAIGQGDSQIGRHGGLTDAALATMDSYYMLCMYWRLVVCRWRLDILLDKLGMDLGGDVGVDVGLERHFGSADDGLHERVVVLGKNQGERDLKTRDTDIVLEHTTLHQVLTGTRVAHMAQGIYYLLWIQNNIIF